MVLKHRDSFPSAGLAPENRYTEAFMATVRIKDIYRENNGFTGTTNGL